MKNKKKTIIYIVLIALLVSWIGYGLKAFQLFSEVKELVTPKTSIMIQLLEFTNYRGAELSALFIVFFILISLNNILAFYLYGKVPLRNRKKSLIYSCSINLILVIFLSVISSVFWVVHVGLAVLSILIISASFYVSNLFFCSTIEFDDGDVVCRSEGYPTKQTANNELKKKSKRMDETNSNLISGDVFQDGEVYYFEIYAKGKVILNSEGEIVIDEKK